MFTCAAGFAYGLFGTLTFAEIALRAREMSDDPRVLLLALLLLVDFGIKAGLFPLYYWLPNSYPTLRLVAAAIVASVLTLFSMLKIWDGAFWNAAPDVPVQIDDRRWVGMTWVVGGLTAISLIVAFLQFLVRFAVEFFRANVKVAWAVLVRSRSSFRPDFIRYDTSDHTHAEILLLSYCVSLTPGTTTVEIADDFKTLTLHALDADRPDALRSEIDRTLKHGILAFTR